MLKSLMRWIDSWSTPTATETLTAENSKIRVAPDFALYSVASGLFRCVLGRGILVCAWFYARVSTDPHVFHHGFFSSLSVA